LARKIAQKLAAELQWDIEVLTTTALDYRTWSNHFPEGETIVEGIKVRRFRNSIKRFGRFDVFHGLTCRYLPSLERRPWLHWAVPLVEALWYKLQGPFCPGLIKYIEKSNESYDAFFYFTYLYYPTVWGLPVLPQKAILVPTAHDEAPFYFRKSQLILELAQRILASTQSEARLIVRRFPPAEPKIRIAGMGIDLEQSKPDSFDRFAEQIKTRYILYLGRVGHAKLIPMLIDYFLRYRASSGDEETCLVLAGGTEPGFEIPKHEKIKYLGFVSEAEKTVLIERSTCLVNPSAYESLSLIVAEAITLQKPVLVNGNCEVLRDYRDSAKTVFPFYNHEDFASYLGSIVSTDWTGDPDRVLELTEAKRAIDLQFQWSKIVEVYAACVASIGSTSASM
jgi:glycosyltransferase involved in cell wall biosynthesis